MKRWLLIGGAAIVVAVIIFASVRSTGPKGEKVYTEKASTRTIESVVTAPGQIDPKVKVNISAHIVGKIEKLYFKEGDSVQRGQKLVELEKRVYIAQRDGLRAELASRRVEVQRARAALRTSQAAYERAQNLSKQGIQAQELFDQARLNYDNSNAALLAADQGVKQSEAGLRQADEDLSRTTIVSPLDGKVVQLDAREGEVVVTGTMNNPGSVIAVIADLSQILAEAEVGETEVDSVKIEQPARIKVDAVVDREYNGHVVEIGSSAAVRQGAGAGIRYFKVKVAIDDADERLRPGMSAQISIVTSRAVNVVAVPIQSVVERIPGEKVTTAAQDDEKPKKKYVFLVKDGKAKQTEVATGISDATHVAILSGVKVGDEIITGPFRTLKKLNAGDSVEVTREVKATSKDEDES
ncbi:MAG TPA: efflux RND transporter periplasmic adaptor subunit [Thermoanaerobaculia bacterium]|jgi:HlyD family secretion protein|nr:efflux RND transporter periplasmic adaptor subunit [Thermoanaerobaculia bacterium]